MRVLFLVVGLVGLPGQAGGQNIPTDLVVSLTFDRSSIGIGETAVATMTAGWMGATGTYLSSVNVDLIASGAFVAVGDIAPVAWNNPALGFNGQGVASGADVIGINAAQFSLMPPFMTDNPILITTFVVTGIAEGLLSYHSVNAAGAPYPFFVQGTSFIDPVVLWTNDVFVSATLVVTPGPGVVGCWRCWGWLVREGGGDEAGVDDDRGGGAGDARVRTDRRVRPGGVADLRSDFGRDRGNRDGHHDGIMDRAGRFVFLRRQCRPDRVGWVCGRQQYCSGGVEQHRAGV
ncbi:MAG: hypothetical protein LAT64_01160 [Phycisphaerales bacterium]|nr:hypothetical protein [Planctomycetota bacterium]MCH8507371.1 hypothetical protein [Phycisphaerales bacterium]